jgi:glycosyltransferase involved in cell wall biosynthesis
MISICIPAYNCEVEALVCTLQQQIDSLQLTAEVLVLDDCSPNPINIKKSHASVRLLRNEQNLGRAKTRNKLIQEAQGDFLLFLDGDSLIISSDYLKKWVAQRNTMGKFSSCFGGSVYQTEEPPYTHLLRWMVSCEKESRPPIERSKKAFGFKTNNVLISKAITNQLQFNEALNGYGHEDTLFGFELEALGYNISHIDNPVKNAILDTNQDFLIKTKEALANLIRCINLATNSPAFIQHVTLLKTYFRLKRYFMLPLLRVYAWFFIKSISRNLENGKSVGMVWRYDLYKLIVFDQLFRSNP